MPADAAFNVLLYTHRGARPRPNDSLERALRPRLLDEVAGLLDGRPFTRVAPLRLDGLAGVLAEIETVVAGRGR